MPYDDTKFKEWLAQQPADVQTLIGERFTALDNSVKATRTERDEAKNNLGGATRKATFFEQASTLNCRNPKVAYALAVTDNLFKEDGSPDWDKVKSAYPDGFSTVNAKTNAGNGTQTIIKTDDWNDSFRTAGHKVTM